LLLDINPKDGVFTMTNKIKGYTPCSERRIGVYFTLWTESKFISPVCSVTLEVVKKYIDEQRTV
jgi:putative transposase